MKFIIDTKNLPGFVQFIALPQHNDRMAYPVAHQFRGGHDLVDRMLALVTQVRERRDWIEINFHDIDAARREFEGGMVVSSAGSPLIVATLHARKMSLSFNGKEIFSDVAEIEKIEASLKKVMRQFEEASQRDQEANEQASGEGGEIEEETEIEERSSPRADRLAGG